MSVDRPYTKKAAKARRDARGQAAMREGVKTERRVAMMIVDVSTDNAREGLDAFNEGLKFARDAIAAGKNVDEITATKTGHTHVIVKLGK